MFLFRFKKNFKLKKLINEMVVLNNLNYFFRKYELLFENNLKRLSDAQLLNILESKSFRGYRLSLVFQHMVNELILMQILQKN